MPTPRSSGRGARRSVTPVALPSVVLSADLVDAVLLAVPTRPDPVEPGRDNEDGPSRDPSPSKGSSKDVASKDVASTGVTDLRAPRPDELGVGTRPERPGGRRRGP